MMNFTEMQKAAVDAVKAAQALAGRGGFNAAENYQRQVQVLARSRLDDKRADLLKAAEKRAAKIEKRLDKEAKKLEKRLAKLGEIKNVASSGTGVDTNQRVEEALQRAESEMLQAFPHGVPAAMRESLAALGHVFTQVKTWKAGKQYAVPDTTLLPEAAEIAETKNLVKSFGVPPEVVRGMPQDLYMAVRNSIANYIVTTAKAAADEAEVQLQEAARPEIHDIDSIETVTPVSEDVVEVEVAAAAAVETPVTEPAVDLTALTEDEIPNTVFGQALKKFKAGSKDLASSQQHARKRK